MSSSHASSSGEPEPEQEGGGEEQSEEEDKNRKAEVAEGEFSLPQLFVTLQLREKKALKKLSRSLPSSISQLEQGFESSFDSSIMFEKRGYFYESVGGVFYTLEWPVKSSSSEPEMPTPNCEHLVQNKTDKITNCGKFPKYFHKYR